MLSREERVRRQAERVLLRRVAQAQPLPDPAPLSPDFLNLTFDQLTFGWDEATEKLIAKECRYPIGDRAPFLYCGQPTVRDSYCAHCFKVTHAPGRAA